MPETVRITFRNSFLLQLIFPWSPTNNWGVAVNVHIVRAFHWLRYTYLTSPVAFCRSHESGQSPKFPNLFIGPVGEVEKPEITPNGLSPLLLDFKGRFPFDQKFRNEILGIPCDEWNNIFRLVGPSRPRPLRFAQGKQIMAECLPLLLDLELLDDSEVETSDVLAEDDITLFTLFSVASCYMSRNRVRDYFKGTIYLFIFLTSSRVTLEWRAK